ncbi:MAG: DUF58 domain-containing protein, partial [Gammaproteobacteria bacterium]|nr:DUF58 domain-containing protein [Gammaproteobacteria bacterium]
LGRRQLYMLPTRAGLLFGLVLLAMLLAAVNYNNGLAYLFTFLLAGVATVSMLITHRNLSGLRVALGPVDPVFAGQLASFPVVLKNHSARARPSLWVLAGDQAQSVDLAPGATQTALVTAAAARRGYLDCPPLTLSTAYPIGLLFSWSRKQRPTGHCLVYPAPGQSRPLPVHPHRARYQQPGVHPEGDDFAGLRAYRDGDPPRHIHWKSVARGQALLVKQFAGAGGGSVWLDWYAVPEPDPETKLRQLCRWALDAESAAVEYGLRLPGVEIPLGQGPDHLHTCLTALALWGNDNV